MVTCIIIYLTSISPSKLNASLFTAEHSAWTKGGAQKVFLNEWMGKNKNEQRVKMSGAECALLIRETHAHWPDQPDHLPYVKGDHTSQFFQDSSIL